MIPVISSMRLLRMKVERNRMTAMMSIEPMKAPISTDINPEKVTPPATMAPPVASITIATPRLAPLLIPRMDGPARGLLKAVCNINPDTAKELPHRSAVRAWGRRD